MKNKEIEELLNEMKDTTQDYFGINGCKYQNLLREEIDLLLLYIEQLEEEKDIEEYNYNSLHGAVVEIARELKIKEPEFTNTEIIIDAINKLQNNRDKAIEYNKNILKENWYGGYEKENEQKNIDILKGGSE